MATTSFPVIPPSVGLKWSPEACQKALDKRAFIRVGGTTATRRFLSGATRSWTNPKPSENQTIFNIQYRITGTPDDIRTALSRAGIDPAEVERAIVDSITVENYSSTKAEEYNLEIRSHQSSKTEKTEAQTYDWAKVLIYCAQNIKSATIGRKNGEQPLPPTTSTRARTGETLAEKMAKLGPDKVIDVSDMDIMTGKTIRTRPRNRSEKNKSGKYGDSQNRIPFVSNNIEKYIGALRWVYGSDAETTFAAEIEDVRNKLQATAGLHTAVAAQVSTLPPATTSTKMIPPAKVPSLTNPSVAPKVEVSAPVTKVPKAPPAKASTTKASPASKIAAPPPAKTGQTLPPVIKTPPSRVTTTGANAYPALPSIKGAAR